MEGDDEVVGVMPIHYTNSLAPDVAVLQFPLLTRPLEVPPSAAASGKRIRARIKPNVRKLEVHVPADIRPEVWNRERAAILGAARLGDDEEKNQESKIKQREGEQPRLSEVRLSSEEIPRAGTYMIGVVRNGMLFFTMVRTVLKQISRKAVSTSHCRDASTTSNTDVYGPPFKKERGAWGRGVWVRG
jgi:DNA-directed RNA polymerase-3 subunit RPC5